ncbi:MAG: amidase [Gammaproteobacteria bacterium]|nr:MAG: amidase [Gammaproteobacteria bacterium]
MDASELSASDAARRLRDGALRSEELTRACLDRIEAAEPTVQAWVHIDPEHALEQARLADERRSSGADIGPLHGLPVGVKDIFDTHDMPTECGTPLMSARQPDRDAGAVAALRDAGAVIMGKTVTTELAMYAPGKTTNPHDPAHTPGGSSSGSAAAVATSMVPLAIGSQTNGSVIRPASFCGVYGFKPSFGAISRSGVLALSRPLDTVGIFGRSVEDLALAAEPLFGFDARDPDTRLRARQHLAETAAQEPPLPPMFAFVKTSVWGEADDDTRNGFAELVDALGEQCDEVELPAPFDDAVRWHRTIMCADLAKNLGQLYDNGRDALSDALRGMIEEGQSCLAVDYNRAVTMIEILNAGLEQVFDRYDAILTPAAPGEAPTGLESTGSPIFCSLWTFVGLPAVSLPLLQGSSSLPIGVQMIGARNGDSRLLRNARWLANHVAR